MKQLMVCFVIIASCSMISCGPEKVRVANATIDEAIPVKMVESLTAPTTATTPVSTAERRVTDYMLIIQPDSSIVMHIRNQITNGWEPSGGIIPYGKEYAQAMVRY